DVPHDPLYLVRFDLWVALVGIQAIDRDDAIWMRDRLLQDVLPPLLAAHPEHNITLLSALAPGGDLIATKAAADFLTAGERQHRLLAVEAVRRRLAIADFEAQWSTNVAGDLEATRAGMTWQQTEQALATAIGAIEAAPSCERVIELDPVGPGAAPDARTAGY